MGWCRLGGVCFTRVAPMMLGLSGGRGGLKWVLTQVQLSAWSSWSVRPAASPAPPATGSPAQVPGRFDPKPAQGGVRRRSPEPWPRRDGTPVTPCSPRRGEGQVSPSGAFPAAAVWKQPSEPVNVSLCTSQPRYSGCRGPTCPAAPIAEHLPADGAARRRLNPCFAGR